MPQESPPLVGDLQINEDLGAHRRAWRAQHIGWTVMVLLLSAALAGLFGRGPLSRATATSAHGAITVEYERFIRNQAEASLVLSLSPAAATNGRGEAHVWLRSAYLDKFEINGIVPEPVAMRLLPDRIVFTFLVDRPGGASHVTMRFKVEHIGPLSGQAGLGASGGDGGDDESAATFGQFAYP